MPRLPRRPRPQHRGAALLHRLPPRQRPDPAFRRFCEAAAAERPIELFGDGRQSRDFTFVADVVEALRAAGEALGAGGRAYNVAGGEPVSLNRAVEELAAIAGRPLDVRRRERESGDVLHTAANVAAARRDLVWAPRTELAAGLAAEFEWVSARRWCARPRAGLPAGRA